jgi:hypothetical protein
VASGVRTREFSSRSNGIFGGPWSGELLGRSEGAQSGCSRSDLCCFEMIALRGPNLELAQGLNEWGCVPEKRAVNTSALTLTEGNDRATGVLLDLSRMSPAPPLMPLFP